MALAIPGTEIDAYEKMHLLLTSLPRAGLTPPGVIAYNLFCLIFIHAAPKPIGVSPDSILAAMLGRLTTFLASGTPHAPIPAVMGSHALSSYYFETT